MPRRVSFFYLREQRSDCKIDIKFGEGEIGDSGRSRDGVTYDSYYPNPTTSVSPIPSKLFIHFRVLTLLTTKTVEVEAS